MPSSRPETISHICLRILGINPTSILDVGVGFGKWGFLSREYTDIRWGRYNRDSWKTVIDGIEVFNTYITDLQKLIYNNIFIGNVMEVLPNLMVYELIIANDIIEHFEKEESKKLISLIELKSKRSIITTPNGFSQQGVYLGNAWERHLCGWTKEELKVFGRVGEVGGKLILETGGSTDVVSK